MSTGTVTKVDAAARTLTLKTDAGQEMNVTLAPAATFRRVAPGATDLSKADTIRSAMWVWATACWPVAKWTAKPWPRRWWW